MKKTLVWAHRGASGYEKENTLAAFRLAVDQGADGVELDVQFSKDEELVIIHDERIDRTTGGQGYVKDYTYDELCDISENQIPTLRQVYELLKPTGLTINVELKTGIFFYPGIEQRVVSLTKEMDMERNVIYSSFNHKSIKKVMKMNIKSEVGLLYGDGFLHVPKYAAKMGVDALHPALYNLQYPHFIEKCKAKDLKLHVWTVNEESHMKLLCEQGIDAIITNYPDKARKVVDSFRK
ncbi:MAG: glycerophosphodiester phosphodiesterase [Lachnospiraceae bacterium]|nr:glycerophosphodiester phosphodiesterase [Lachnospiraceae bacterium]